MVCLRILVEATSIQGELLQLTGSTIDPSTLGSPLNTTDAPLLQLPSDLEMELQQKINILKETVTFNKDVLKILEQVKNGNINLNEEGKDCSEFFMSVFDFFALLVKSKYGHELQESKDVVSSIAIGGFITLSSSCSDVELEAFDMTIAAMKDTNFNILGTVTKVTQTMVVSSGLIIDTVSTSASYKEQADGLAESLSINRMNCEGMDRVGAKLLELIGSKNATQYCRTDADLTPLFEAVTNLMVAATSSLEDNNIFQMTQDIVALVEALDISCISVRIKIRIQMVVIGLKDTVTTYVSQIAMVEQRRLQITGSLNFSTSVQLDQEPEEYDFELREKIQREQLKGLMFCGDFTDRTTESILASQQVTDPREGDCNGETILKGAQKVAAMCGANNLQLDDIRANTQELARCSANLGEPLTEGQLKSLDFILVILSSFRVTFSSQIAFVQQKLSILTGQKIDAAALGIQFIGSDGALFDVEAEGLVVPLNPLDKPENALEYEITLLEDWKDLIFVFTTMKTTISSVERVLDIQGLELHGDGTCFDFLALVQVYFKMLSQGKFSKDDIFMISSEIITSSAKVGGECSSREKFTVWSILKSIKNYQLVFTSDLVTLQMKLMQMIKVQVSSLQMTFEGITQQGQLTEYHVGVSCESRQKHFYQQKIANLSRSLQNIQDLCDYVDYVYAMVEVDITRTSRITFNGTISSSEFLEVLGSLLFGLSEDVSSLEKDEVLAIQDLSVDTAFSKREMDSFVGLKDTLVAHMVQMGAEMAIARSELHSLELQGGSALVLSNVSLGHLEQNASAIIHKIQKLSKMSEYLEETQLTCSLKNPTDSSDFVDFVLSNVFIPLSKVDLRSQVDNESSLWDMMDQLQEHQNVGIKCLKGSDSITLVSIRAVLQIYEDMLSNELASIQAEILERVKECPSGYYVGDWSDGSGECCCNPAIKHNIEDNGQGNLNNTAERCHQENKVCECRLCPKPCLIEKLTGLFANFEALARTTQSIEAVIGCSSNSTDDSLPEDFAQVIESLIALLNEYTPTNLYRKEIMELTIEIVEMSVRTGCPTEG